MATEQSLGLDGHGAQPPLHVSDAAHEHMVCGAGQRESGLLVGTCPPSRGDGSNPVPLSPAPHIFTENCDIQTRPAHSRKFPD